MERPAPSVARLAAELTAVSTPTPFVGELACWLAGSTRFRAFAEANAPKVHRKLRDARDDDAVRDVRAELALAASLLADRRFDLAFEAYGSGRRGPDFTVTFRSTVRFNIEITRRRGPAAAGSVVDAVLEKLRQMPPSVANVVVVAVDGAIGEGDLTTSIHELLARVDRLDRGVVARLGIERPRDFYESFLRVGAVVAWAERAAAGSQATMWVNPAARIPVDRAALAAVAGALAVGADPLDAQSGTRRRTRRP